MGLIDILIGRGYLTRTDDPFPHCQAEQKSREALGKDARILISVREETPKKRGKVIALREELTPYGQKHLNSCAHGAPVAPPTKACPRMS